MFIVVHDVRFPIHDVLGFPLRLPPGRVPWIRSFSRQTSFFLRMCPKYVIFLAFRLANSCLCVPALSRTHSLVFFFSVHLTRSSFLRFFISNALILSSSAFFRVQLSQEYVATVHVNVFISYCTPVFQPSAIELFRSPFLDCGTHCHTLCPRQRHH